VVLVTSVRRHVVTLVVVVAALAVGIAVGGGPLSDLGRTPTPAAADPGPAPQAKPNAGAAYADAFATSVAANLYAGRLHAHPVALLTLPGADPDAVAALTDQVRAAGTQVIATYALKRTLVDPEQKSLVDTLGLQLVAQLGSDVVTADATTYDRIGQLMGKAVSATTRSAAMDPGRIASLRASLKGAGLLGLPDDEPNVAPLVLVVTGKDVEQPVLSGLAAGLAAVAKGVVVAGPADDAGIAALRSQPPIRPVATVDGTDTAAGQVAAVLALVHVLATPGGSFGASGSDAAVPLG
jgi:hypothetical protein